MTGRYDLEIRFLRLDIEAARDVQADERDAPDE